MSGQHFFSIIYTVDGDFSLGYEMVISHIVTQE